MKLNLQKLQGWGTVWWKFHNPNTDRRTGDSIYAL